MVHIIPVLEIQSCTVFARMDHTSSDSLLQLGGTICQN